MDSARAGGGGRVCGRMALAGAGSISGWPRRRRAIRVCLLASALALVAAAIPLAPGPVWACVEISFSFFAVAAFSVNMYSLPLDTFGGARAAFAVSMLTASAGVAGLISPLFGRLIDLHGYGPVMGIAALMPLAGVRHFEAHEVRGVKQRLKQWIFRLLGKDPEAVVVTFETGDPELCRRMAEEVQDAWFRSAAIST